MLQLKQFLIEERSTQTIYPKGNEYFAALNITPIEQVKVVILGQDPYHGENQAHGLSFSVKQGVQAPPSLINIFKEMHSDIGINIPKHGDLTYWSKQGVLLLNTVLTVRAGQAGSHRGKGWESFTDKIIKIINKNMLNIIFVLWGSAAQAKRQIIDNNKHIIITSPHPSPLSAHRGFFGSKPFSKINHYLQKQNKKPIDWSI